MLPLCIYENDIPITIDWKVQTINAGGYVAKTAHDLYNLLRDNQLLNNEEYRLSGAKLEACIIGMIELLTIKTKKSHIVHINPNNIRSKHEKIQSIYTPLQRQELLLSYPQIEEQHSKGQLIFDNK